MRRILLIGMLSCFGLASFAQMSMDSGKCQKTKSEEFDKEHFVETDKMPAFKKEPSYDRMMAFIDKKIKKSAIPHQGKMSVYMTFLVEKDGSLSQIHSVKSIDRKLEDELIDIFQSMPKWKPAMCGEDPVVCRYNVAVQL